MKQISFIVALINFLAITLESCEAKEPEIILKAVIKGCYKLPQTVDNLSITNDSVDYFLIELILCNLGEHSIKFLTYKCTPTFNVILDTKLINISVNNCSNNPIITVELNSKQELSLPVILQTNKVNSFREIKIGWFYFSPKQIDEFNNSKVFIENKQSLKSVIWSEPLVLNPMDGRSYEIK